MHRLRFCEQGLGGATIQTDGNILWMENRSFKRGFVMSRWAGLLAANRRPDRKPHRLFRRMRIINWNSLWIKVDFIGYPMLVMPIRRTIRPYFTSSRPL